MCYILISWLHDSICLTFQLIYRPELEALSGDIIGTITDAKLHLAKVDEWAARRSVATPGFLLPGTSFVQPEPLGVVLVIGPWNYPISLIINPLVAAIAAGNTVVVKPSEVSTHCAVLLQGLFSRYLDPSAIRVVQVRLLECLRWRECLGKLTCILSPRLCRVAQKRRLPCFVNALTTSSTQATGPSVALFFGYAEGRACSRGVESTDLAYPTSLCRRPRSTSRQLHLS